MQQRDDGSGVGDVFFAHQPNRKLTEPRAGQPNFKCRGATITKGRGSGGRRRWLAGRRLDPVSRQRVVAVADGPRVTREQVRETRIVGAENQSLPGLLGKLLELPADGLEVGVVVEVLLIDVENDRVVRPEFAQAAIAFIGLDHKVRRVKVRTGSKPGVRLQLWHQRPDGVTRSGVQLFERKSQQRRGGRFAMHPGHADAALTVQQRGEQCRAADDGHVQLLGGLQFRIVSGDRRGIDHEHGPGGAELIAPMTLVNFRAPRPELKHLAIAGQIRALDALTQVQQQMAEATHPATARAHEVNHGVGARALEQLVNLMRSELIHAGTERVGSELSWRGGEAACTP